MFCLGITDVPMRHVLIPQAARLPDFLFPSRSTRMSLPSAEPGAFDMTGDRDWFVVTGLVCGAAPVLLPLPGTADTPSALVLASGHGLVAELAGPAFTGTLLDPPVTSVGELTTLQAHGLAPSNDTCPL